MPSDKNPFACPFIGSCEAYVDYLHFDTICNSTAMPAYKRCKMYQEKAKQMKRPAEWMKLIGGDKA